MAFEPAHGASSAAAKPLKPCAYDLCDGSGMIVDDAANETYRCRCWPEQLQRRRARRLSREVPKRFRNVGFEREPIPSIARTAPDVVRAVRRYCDRVGEMLDRGEGMWFLGSPGTGKSHLAYLISQHALAAGRSTAIYTGPRLLDEIRRTYGDDESGSTLDLIDRLTNVELLHIEDLAVARPTDWVLEQLYNIINGRYENEKSIVFTCDLTGDAEEGSDKFDPSWLARHITMRNFSRLVEMCGDPQLLMGADARRVEYRAHAWES
ncbi:ATP-binding protein [Conexibacter sp. CPCC 206217]|uniref:ATP-binding protein n=1 Tax=Conexibacter sp. CPCC 206217 TaxID=3064574 RepID=UPI002723680E|nr:ATP-binding protein [Conexibacter sp. CPCC 206217]MDO8210747.1 ATP-binding protein [Conexibacter sp. CPCC 206217]